MNKANIYVCSKPLQYFNVTNLPREADTKNVLVIENRFKEAEKFYEKIKKIDRSWDEVIFLSNRIQLLALCLFRFRVVNFYYYLDWLLVPALMLYLLPAKQIYIYEEGVGSYRLDIFNKTSATRRKVRKWLRISEYPGLHPRVEGMYVYGAEFYKQRFEGRGKVLNVLSFVKPFNVMLAIMNSRAIELFEINQKETFQMISGCNVLVYISTWPFDISELSALNTEAYDYCIVKLHPHIQQFKEDKGDNGRFIFVGTTILAEVLISVLLENNNQLYIYHHNSTSTIYLSEKQHNIKSIRNIALHQDEYNIIYKGLKPAS